MGLNANSLHCVEYWSITQKKIENYKSSLSSYSKYSSTVQDGVLLILIFCWFLTNLPVQSKFWASWTSPAVLCIISSNFSPEVPSKFVLSYINMSGLLQSRCKLHCTCIVHTCRPTCSCNWAQLVDDSCSVCSVCVIRVNMCLNHCHKPSFMNDFRSFRLSISVWVSRQIIQFVVITRQLLYLTSELYSSLYIHNLWGLYKKKLMDL